MTDQFVQSRIVWLLELHAGPGRHLENVVGLSLWDQLLCSESDDVVAGAPLGLEAIWKCSGIILL